MATVVNTFPDRRSALLGRGIGALVGSVMEARKKKREEEEERKKLGLAFDLMERASSGEKALSPAQGSQTQQPQRTQVRQGIESENLPPLQGRVPTGGDVGMAFTDAGLESDFAIKLAQGINQAKQQREKQALEDTELQNVLLKAGGSEELLTSAIALAKISPDLKLRLIPHIKNLAAQAPEDKEFVNITVYQLENGQQAPARIPKELEGQSVAVVDKYLQDLGLEVTSQPKLQTTGEERQFQRDIRTLGGSEDIEHIAAAQNRGLVTVHTTPQGDQILTNLATRETSFTSSPKMDVVAERKIQFRIAAINETLSQLGVDPQTGRRVPGKGLDLEGGLGLEGFLTAEVGGFISNIFLGDMALDFMGIEPSEIARAQAARSGFFNVVVPFAEAISSGEGSRDIITSKFGIGIAQEILTIRELSTTNAGAEQAIDRIVKLFTGLRSIMEVQLRHGTMLRPKMLSVKWNQLEDNRIKGELELEGK